MVNGDSQNPEGGFALQVRVHAQAKADEIRELEQEIKRLEVKVARTKAYFDKLNSFLELEGQRPVLVKQVGATGGVGKPGNRAKDLPVRKVQWAGMGLFDIVDRVLNAAPDEAYQPQDAASQIYEIHSDTDLHRVIKNVRSTMQRGARSGRWVRVGRGKFKAKAKGQEGLLVNA